MKSIICWSAALLLAAITATSRAQTPAVEAEPLLPTDSRLWINSPPLTDEMVRGKGVFLWFFDDQCPRCRGKWPELIQTANQLSNEPVIFVAINSGSPPADVASYVRSVNLPWPVIADVNREFEAKAGVGEISLRNIWQAAIITPDGQIERASFNDIPGAVSRAAQGASWKVEPEKIPAELKPAWWAIEFGEYAPAARDVMKHKDSSNEALQSAAQSLYAVVHEDLQKEGSHAWELGQEKKFYEAYVAMTRVKERFHGYDIPDAFLKAHEWLAQKDEVRDELKAANVLDDVRKMLGSSRAAIQKRGMTGLQNIVERYPNTQAASEAQELLGQAQP